MKQLVRIIQNFKIVGATRTIITIVNSYDNKEQVKALAGRLGVLCDQFVDINKEFVDGSNMRAADKNVDAMFRTVKMLVDAYSRWPEADIQSAAKHLYGMVSEYGHFSRKSYDEKPVAVESLVTDLGKDGVKDMVALIPGLPAAVAKLKEYGEVMAASHYEHSSLVSAKMSQAKSRDIVRQIAGILNDELLVLLNAAAIEDPANFKKQFDDVENTIEQYNAAFRSRWNKKGTEPEN